MFLSNSLIIDQFILKSKLANKNLPCRTCVRRGQHMWVSRPFITVTVQFYFKININIEGELLENNIER